MAYEAFSKYIGAGTEREMTANIGVNRHRIVFSAKLSRLIDELVIEGFDRVRFLIDRENENQLAMELAEDGDYTLTKIRSKGKTFVYSVFARKLLDFRPNFTKGKYKVDLTQAGKIVRMEIVATSRLE